jgi:hypothetical protein
MLTVREVVQGIHGDRQNQASKKFRQAPKKKHPQLKQPNLAQYLGMVMQLFTEKLGYD